MEAISSVVKSKSSNSTKTNRSDHQHKKSRSNAEFQPNVLKKRGVYVERKPFKTSIAEPAQKRPNQAQERPIKAPPRPRPGNKRFLDSVLTILSKSTTGTQYPDKDDLTAEKKTKRRTSAKKNNQNTKHDDANQVKTKRKTKYRSKALNDDVAKEVNQEQVVVLQEQKNLIQTPSIYSENDSFNWSNLPLLVKKNQENKETAETNIVEVANTLAKEIMEGQKMRKDRKVRIDEPTTLVAEITKKEPNEKVTCANSGEKDKKMYDFFVDLLETTISVYNVKAEYDKAPIPLSEGSSDKIALEMDESVAKKLNVESTKPERKEEKDEPQFCCLKDLEFNQSYSSPPQSDYPRKCFRKKKFLAESFSFLRKPTTRKLTAASVVETKKCTRKQKKKTLLNLFKEQLRIDSDAAFEEPQNLYQALKVIAQNKRRCQKTIHFEDCIKKKHRDMGFPECMFKRRKVISNSTKVTKKNKNLIYYASSVTGRYSSEYQSTRKNYDYDPYYDASNHSLEVYGYDYEDPVAKKPTFDRNKQPPYAYQSSPSESLHDQVSDDYLTVSDSVFFSEFKSN
ncbi:hypothetical protein ABMA28_012658 [Loxostege sticticalis]|uniref:Uncharacterized protein n=1 Tax=Loxostege sticticalis TaxID=481309 RepID=A0ABD0S4K3_LOXSC